MRGGLAVIVGRGEERQSSGKGFGEEISQVPDVKTRRPLDDRNSVM